MTGVDVNQLTDVAIRFGPVELVAPRLLDARRISGQTHSPVRLKPDTTLCYGSTAGHSDCPRVRSSTPARSLRLSPASRRDARAPAGRRRELPRAPVWRRESRPV